MSDDLTRHVWNMNKIRQFISFANLTIGGNSRNRPTDIDGLLELRDKLFILFEVKMLGNDMPTGQRLSLERVADALTATKPTLLIVAEHHTPSDQPVDLAACTVAKVRYNREWISRVPYRTVREMVDKFIDFVEGTAEMNLSESTDNPSLDR